MGTLIQDLRFGYRMLIKDPAFTCIVVLTLALGIGANSTIFSWINSTLLTPIPAVGSAGNLVVFVRGDGGSNATPPLSYPDYVDLRSRSRSFAGLLAYHDDWMAFTGNGQPERVYGAMVSANYFGVLGVKPLLGRDFLAEEEMKPGGAPVAIISYGLWRARFGGDASILGRVVEINRRPYTILGVAPSGFQGCKTGLRADIWTPLSMAQAITGLDQLSPRDNFWFNVTGRPNSGITPRQAQEETNVLMSQIVQQYPREHLTACAIKLEPLWRSSIGANSLLHVFLPMLLAIAGFVLLLACANVANLLLVRSVGRRREFAIRLSLGASRWRLVRQLLLESLMLALTGGLAASLVTLWTASLFDYFLPPVAVPLFIDIQVDRTVFLATMILSVITGVIFGTLPALRASSLSAAAIMKEEAGSVSGGIHKSRLTGALVVVQISLSMLLLICAGLFVRSFQNSRRCNPGFDTDHMLLTTFDLLPADYSMQDGLEFDRQLLARLEALPGVESVTLADSVPLCFNNHSSIVAPEGYVPRVHESMEIGRAYVGPNYLRTMRIPLLAGRDLTLQDTERSRKAAIVNEAFAKRYWPGQEALGRRIQTEGSWWTVVGIARNSMWARLDDAPLPLLFLPLFQDYYHEAIIHLRVSGDPQAYAATVSRTIHELDPNLPAFDVTTLETRTQVAGFLGRIAGSMVGVFGLIALMLAAVGIYGVISNSTRQRTHEIGVRMAIGADRAAILRLVLVQGLRLAMAGLALGLVLALMVTPFLRAQLYGVETTDIKTYLVVGILLCFVALAAAYLPARRAVRINPMMSLRCQ